MSCVKIILVFTFDVILSLRDAESEGFWSGWLNFIHRYYVKNS